MSNNNNEIDKLDEYVIDASTITNRPWQDSLKKIYFKVLREAQQKRLMESNIIKSTKKEIKIIDVHVAKIFFNIYIQLILANLLQK